MMAFELPWPPTVNNYYTVSRNRKILSQDGRSYKRLATDVIRSQFRGHAKITGEVSVLLLGNPPDRRKRDSDNYTKAALDAMTNAGVWCDDVQCRDTRIVMLDRVPGGKMVAKITAFDRAEWGLE